MSQNIFFEIKDVSPAAKKEIFDLKKALEKKAGTPVFEEFAYKNGAITGWSTSLTAFNFKAYTQIYNNIIKFFRAISKEFKLAIKINDECRDKKYAIKSGSGGELMYES